MARSIAVSSLIEGRILAPEFIGVLTEVIDGTREADDVIRVLQVQYRQSVGV